MSGRNTSNGPPPDFDNIPPAGPDDYGQPAPAPQARGRQPQQYERRAPGNEVMAIPGARLPMPKGVDTTPEQWRVLTNAIFPAARTSEAVMLALDYCRARKLDPLKRVVHIVPMWNSQLKAEVETVWPGISELQTTASRTGEWVGMDEPRWGPEVERTFSGEVREWQDRREVTVDRRVTLKYPEWCSVTVYRRVHGERAAFSEPVYWEEAYAPISRWCEIPNAMWTKRIRGQLLKCAKAASLRAAFPDELGSDYAAEEMEGRDTAGGIVIPGTTTEETGRSKLDELEDYVAQRDARTTPPSQQTKPAQESSKTEEVDSGFWVQVVNDDGEPDALTFDDPVRFAKWLSIVQADSLENVLHYNADAIEQARDASKEAAAIIGRLRQRDGGEGGGQEIAQQQKERSPQDVKDNKTASDMAESIAGARTLNELDAICQSQATKVFSNRMKRDQPGLAEKLKGAYRESFKGMTATLVSQVDGAATQMDLENIMTPTASVLVTRLRHEFSDLAQQADDALARAKARFAPQ